MKQSKEHTPQTQDRGTVVHHLKADDVVIELDPFVMRALEKGYEATEELEALKARKPRKPRRIPQRKLIENATDADLAVTGLNPDGSIDTAPAKTEAEPEAAEIAPLDEWRARRAG